MKITYTFANCDNIYLWKMNRIQKVDDVTKEHIIQQKQSSEHKIWKPIIFVLSILGIQQHQDLPLTDQSVYGTSRVESQDCLCVYLFCDSQYKMEQQQFDSNSERKKHKQSQERPPSLFWFGTLLRKVLVPPPEREESSVPLLRAQQMPLVTLPEFPIKCIEFLLM